jgi:hypothetical protein
MKLSKDTPVKELLAIYNERAGTSLASWKTGKDKLIEKIEALPAPAANAISYDDAIEKAGASELDSIQVASEKMLEAVAHIHEGKPWGIPYKVILAEVHRLFPDCNTTVACLRWYAAKMTDLNITLPKRKRGA